MPKFKSPWNLKAPLHQLKIFWTSFAKSMPTGAAFPAQKSTRAQVLYLFQLEDKSTLKVYGSPLLECTLVKGLCSRVWAPSNSTISPDISNWSLLQPSSNYRRYTHGLLPKRVGPGALSTILTKHLSRGQHQSTVPLVSVIKRRAEFPLVPQFFFSLEVFYIQI